AVRAAWYRRLSALQEVVRRVLLPEAPQRDPRRGWAVLRRPQRGRLRTLLRVHPRRRPGFPRRLPADRRASQGHPVRRTRARVSAVPAWPLRGIQPGLRPRHAVRPAIGRTHRINPDEPAAARAFRIRLYAGTRLRRSEAGRLPETARLALKRGVSGEE